MIKRIIPVLILLMLLMAQPALAADTLNNNGKIEGSIVNKTAGTTSSVADQTVILNVYTGNTQTDAKTTRTNNDGKFIFEGLATDSSSAYEAEITYLGAEYFSAPIQFSPGETVKSADVEVYDPTTSSDAVSVMLSHLILSLDNGSLLVKEYYLFINNSDQAFVGQPSADLVGKRETLRFSLPPEATGMQVNVGLAESGIIRRGQDFFDTSPVTPTGREISYSYRIPFNSDKKTLSWKPNYNISRFDLLLQDPQIKVTGDRLTEEASLYISNKTYNHFSSQDLAAGGTLTMQLSGLTGSSAGGFNWVWLAVIPVLAAGLILARRMRSRRAGVKTNPNSSPAREELLAAIATLDDSYEEGEIAQSDYLRLRSEKKQRLKELMQESEKKDV